jgi:hypothetical protein
MEHSCLEWFRPFVEVEVESEATEMLEYEPQAVPGLLQTEDYARAQIRTGRVRDSDEEIEKHVAARMSRQEVLTRSDPPLLWADLDEAVLRRPVGGAHVMRDRRGELWLTRTRRPGTKPDRSVADFEAAAAAALTLP